MPLLRPFTNLRSIDFRGFRIVASEMHHLAHMGNLKRVDLTGQDDIADVTLLTKAGIKVKADKKVKGRPRCVIS